MTDFVVKNGLQIGGGSKLKSGTIAGNATLDLTTGNFFSHTPTADTTFVFNNPPAAGKAHGFALKVTGVDIGVSYDLANASYDGVSFSVAAQDTSPNSLFFRPDGTKMYMLGESGDRVNEYNLSTAWDISTATFFQNFSVGAQENDVQGLFFKPDGLKMYVIGKNGDDVNEYNLSTAWYISTASFLQNFSVAAQDGQVYDVFFKPDGAVMYVLGRTGSNIYEYSLSTAWDVSTSSYLRSFSVASQDGDPAGLFFKPDGTKMYVTGMAGDDINEYNLSTAWNVSSASFIRNFSVAAQSLDPTAVFFKSDGTKMYVLCSLDTNAVFQYSTGASDIVTFTYPASVKFPNGTSPTAPADGETDLLTFYTDDGGVSYYGIQRGDNMS